MTIANVLEPITSTTISNKERNSFLFDKKIRLNSYFFSNE